MNDNATQPQPRLVFSVEAAAEVLSISRTRMFALIKTGEMPSIRVGRLRRIPAGALATALPTAVPIRLHEPRPLVP
ncbi:MAG: hypothetical protein QOF99_5851 [Pseudonocardiales bacterium]|jgi:excisionase family DNA binding protein|nr:hypothetical protein [Pseudonocardiales bacterium]